MLKDDIRQEIIDICRAYPEVVRVYLYGSQTGGPAGMVSDIDLAVEAPGMEAADYADLVLRLRDELSTLLPVDVVRLDGDNASDLRKRIYTEGQLLWGPELKAQRSLVKLERSLNKLAESCHVENEVNGLQIDAALHRFEFAWDRLVKAWECFLALEGIRAYAPRDIVKQAYLLGWIDNEGLWLRCLSDRLAAGEVYSDQDGVALFSNVRLYLPFMQSAYAVLSKRKY